MKIAALILGLLGGLGSLGMAAMADMVLGVAGMMGLEEGPRALLKMLLWGIPIASLVGGGMAPAKPKAGGILMLASAAGLFIVGAYFGHGFNFITGGTLLLTGIGGMMALMAPDEAASAGQFPQSPAYAPAQPPAYTPARQTPQAGAPARADYDRAKWEALAKYDPDIAHVVKLLEPLGQEWVDECAVSYLALNDKAYLPRILKKIHADHAASQEAKAKAEVERQAQEAQRLAEKEARRAEEAARYAEAIRLQEVPSAGGDASLTLQLRIRGLLLAVVLVAGASLVWLDNRTTSQGTAYASAVGQMRMLSQRMDKAAQQDLQGNPAFFKELKDSRDTFNVLLAAVTRGGNIEGVGVAGLTDQADTGPLLQALNNKWGETDKYIAVVLQHEKSLVALGKAVGDINTGNSRLFELSDQVAVSSKDASAAKLPMLSQRIAKNANALLVGGAIDPESAYQVGKDMITFRETLGKLGASEASQNLDAAFKVYEMAIGGILGNMQSLIQAKEAGSHIIRDASSLFEASDKLEKLLTGHLHSHGLTTLATFAMVFLVLLILVSMAKAVNGDAQRRGREAEAQRQQADITES